MKIEVIEKKREPAKTDVEFVVGGVYVTTEGVYRLLVANGYEFATVDFNGCVQLELQRQGTLINDMRGFGYTLIPTENVKLVITREVD